jgi:hypothetical protein
MPPPKTFTIPGIATSLERSMIMCHRVLLSGLSDVLEIPRPLAWGLDSEITYGVICQATPPP